MPAGLQVNLPATKLDAFCLQQETLLQPQLSGQGDAASGAEYSLPRQTSDLIENLGYVPSAARIARGLGDRSVSAHSTAWNLPYHRCNGTRHC